MIFPLQSDGVVVGYIWRQWLGRPKLDSGGMNRLFAAVAEIKDSRCIVEIGVERCDINVTRKITLFVAMGTGTYMCIYVE